MATGRIGVTPTLRTRWSKAPAGGTTSLSGLDDNSVSLVYDVGYEAVYRNGVLLSRTNDYTATTGNSITLIDATIAGDIIEVFANQLLPLTNAIGNGQYTAKGALLSATAASTPAVLTVGSNDQVLTADSSTATGLKWATPSAGGMTLLSTTTLSGNSVTISSISGSYKNLHIIGRGIYSSANENVQIRFNSDTGSNYAWSRVRATGSTLVGANATGNTSIDLLEDFTGSAWNTAGFFELLIPRYSESEIKAIWLRSLGSADPAPRKVDWTQGTWNSTSAITSITIRNEGAGTTFSGGTVYIYGVS